MQASTISAHGTLANNRQVSFGDNYYRDTPKNRVYCSQWEDSRCPGGGWSTKEDWAAIRPHRPKSHRIGNHFREHGSAFLNHGNPRVNSARSASEGFFSVDHAMNYFSHLSTQGWLVLGLGALSVVLLAKTMFFGNGGGKPKPPGK